MKAVAEKTGEPGSTVIRAALKLALPAFEASPEIVRLLEAGVFNDLPADELVRRYAEYVKAPDALRSKRASSDAWAISPETAEDIFKRTVNEFRTRLSEELESAKSRTIIFDFKAGSLPLTFTQELWKELTDSAKRLGCPLEELAGNMLKYSINEARKHFAKMDKQKTEPDESPSALEGGDSWGGVEVGSGFSVRRLVPTAAKASNPSKKKRGK